MRKSSDRSGAVGIDDEDLETVAGGIQNTTLSPPPAPVNMDQMMNDWASSMNWSHSDGQYRSFEAGTPSDPGALDDKGLTPDDRMVMWVEEERMSEGSDNTG